MLKGTFHKPIAFQLIMGNQTILPLKILLTTISCMAKRSHPTKRNIYLSQMRDLSGDSRRKHYIICIHAKKDIPTAKIQALIQSIHETVASRRNNT